MALQDAARHAGRGAVRQGEGPQCVRHITESRCRATRLPLGGDVTARRAAEMVCCLGLLLVAAVEDKRSAFRRDAADQRGAKAMQGAFAFRSLAAQSRRRGRWLP